MAETSVSIAATFEPTMGNISGFQSDESRVRLPQQILPAILAGGWRLSTWQYIVLFLVGLVVYDQGD
jgi:hypothetical protein